MSKKVESKQRYETPVVMPLGELAQGSGECCYGSVPHGHGGGHCTAGPCARRSCGDGSMVGAKCCGGSHA